MITVSLTTALAMTNSCGDKYLERPPVGAISEATLGNRTGVEGTLIQAYRTLRGPGGWYTTPMNWGWGSIRADEAYKGSEAADQANELNPVERLEILPNHGPTGNKWNACYDGVGIANQTLRLLDLAKDMTDAEKLSVEAQALFLRGFHHFEAKRLFNKVPFVDKDVDTPAEYRAITNDADIYPLIEKDLKFAYDNLPETQPQIGRVNKWAAGAFLAKALLYQKKYAEAKVIFDAIIGPDPKKAIGKTSAGENYALLDKFSEVFRGANENSREIMFGVQVTVGDGTGGANSNQELELPNPHNQGPVGCCGFFQPTQTLVNSYQTQNGLPLPDPQAVKVPDHESNAGVAPYRGALDPRLDWTVGRIGIQYLDHGPAEPSWIRNTPNGGPYLPKKLNATKGETGTYQISGGWGQGSSGRNILLMRYADLLLMAAEVEIEVGSLEKAREYVNLVRARAANPEDFVKNAAGTPEAAYAVSQYTSAAFADKTAATNAVQLERLLELALEGHRFFDLVRWGIAAQVMNTHFAREAALRSHLVGARFDEGVDNYLPIPEYVIAQSGGAIKQ